jgi:hypothetical protein
MRLVIGIVARLAVYACFALILGDAFFELWRDHHVVLAVLALIFFPATIFIWPITHLGDTVFGLKLWLVFVTALVAYPVSTFIGGMRPIEGFPRKRLLRTTSSLSAEDRSFVSGRSATGTHQDSAEEVASADEYPMMKQVFGEDVFNEWTRSLIERRNQGQAIEDDVKRQIAVDLPDRPDQWAAEFDRRMMRLYEDEEREEERRAERAKASASAGEAYETARFIEREVIAAGLADRCEAHVDVDEGGNPYLASLETYGTERIPRGRIEELVNQELVKRRRW